MKIINCKENKITNIDTKIRKFLNRCTLDDIIKTQFAEETRKILEKIYYNEIIETQNKLNKNIKMFTNEEVEQMDFRVGNKYRDYIKSISKYI